MITLQDALLLWRPVFEILILWFVIYNIILFLTGTRAKQVLAGIAILILVFILSDRLGLKEVSWIMERILGISVIAILIIFQPEIRQGLARLWPRRLFSSISGEEQMENILQELGNAAEAISRNRFGALIAIENHDSLKAYLESGVSIDASLSSELLEAIFTPNNPLHDGGVIIQGGRIVAAGCLFPISEKENLSRIFGTRHRAALGLSEETDALVLIVSEERGEISLVSRGKLYKDLSKEELILNIKEALNLK